MTCRRVRELRRLAREFGRELGTTRSGHLAFRKAGAAQIVASGTPRSDGVKGTRALLRRAEREGAPS